METKVTAEDIRRRLQSLGLTVTAAAKVLGMTRQNLNKHLSAKKLSPHFTRLFKEKLGLETSVVELTNIQVNKVNTSNQVRPVSFEDRSVMLVPFVNNYARAGYLTGYTSETYIDRLPKLPWMVDKEYKGTYMCFEVNGDSMDDGTRDSYMEGDILLCREIAPHLWVSSKLHIRKWDFVIAHKTEGIIVKRIIEHNVDKGTIVVHSLNDLYPDYTIQLKDVVKIFNVVKVERSK